MTWEVLDAPSDSCVFESLQIVGYHWCCRLRIVREGTCTYDNVLRVSIDIGYWCEVNVKSVVVKVGSYGIATFVSICRVARCTNGAHRLVFLYREVAVVGDTCYATAFLIDA